MARKTLMSRGILFVRLNSPVGLTCLLMAYNVGSLVKNVTINSTFSQIYNQSDK